MPKNNENASMVNNSNHTSTSTSTTTESTQSEYLNRYSQNNLLHAVEELFSTNNIAFMTNHLSDLMFLATHPDDSKELGKDQIVNIVNDQMSILSYLSKAYIHYKEWYSYKKESTLNL